MAKGLASRGRQKADRTLCAGERDFVSAELVGVDLRDAKLGGANFENARLESVDFYGAFLRGARFVNTHIESGRFSMRFFEMVASTPTLEKILPENSESISSPTSRSGRSTTRSRLRSDDCSKTSARARSQTAWLPNRSASLSRSRPRHARSWR